MTDSLPHALAALSLLGWFGHSLWLSRRLSAARRDPLTGLRTRAAFTARAHRALRRPDASVLLLDLDRFKQINDSFGHAAGDSLLAAVGERLGKWCTDHGGFAGRLGGDEFAAVVHIDDERADDHITDLSRCLSEPVRLGHRAVVPRASIGICRPGDRSGAPLDERLRAADEAMYTAKSLGGRWRPASSHNTYATAMGRRVGRLGTRHASPTQ
ncbi:GGDEF domain-containing protein [Streptomyces tirandamycinicus]|uniref:GGDEF domain-containing protein n=1 Tax=Streptomyces tirandamycinicus TaxID=2174846 RepID=A0A2S1SVW5_9ACTN|nr:GGDEF domain-containing protein [Streptomyces tirandamycinicus]AWI30417.1 GGDEF domain-containing protein [Streptomyces tirandamycinicus]